MAWKDARGSGRVAVTAVRQVAHSDQTGSHHAKSRRDEATRSTNPPSGQSLSRRVLVGAGVAVVVLALVAFLVLRGGGSTPSASPAPRSPAPTASASPTGPTAVDVMTASQPSGKWKLVIV